MKILKCEPEEIKNPWLLQRVDGEAVSQLREIAHRTWNEGKQAVLDQMVEVSEKDFNMIARKWFRLIAYWPEESMPFTQFLKEQLEKKV